MSNKKQIEIGDVVSLRDEEEANLYIVLNIENFSDEEIRDIDYELAKIYPQSRNMSIVVEGHDNVSLYTKKDSSSFVLLMNKLIKDRKEYGWGEKVDYLEMVEKSLSKKYTKSKKITIMPKFIDVNYSSYETIDECLDALKDLNDLYEMFNDKEYLKKKAIVIKRMKQLSKK